MQAHIRGSLGILKELIERSKLVFSPIPVRNHLSILTWPKQIRIRLCLVLHDHSMIVSIVIPIINPYIKLSTVLDSSVANQKGNTTMIEQTNINIGGDVPNISQF